MRVCFAAIVAVAFTMVAWDAPSHAVPDDPDIAVGGRLEYSLVLDEGSEPFPYNSATHSVFDHTRIMLDFRALGTRYGSFYVKGQALWDDVRPTQIQKRFTFEQGDYLWQDDVRHLFYSLRVFANERRYITYDMIAPLLDDDVLTDGNDNRGLRFDGTIAGSVDVIAIYSALQATLDKWRDIAYLRGAYFVKSMMFSLSYLYEDGAFDGSLNHAIAKAEANASYKQLFVTLSYEQSQFSNATVFWPSGSFGSGNPASAFPDNAAVAAEARLTSVPVGDWGRLRLVWRYGYSGDQFVNALAPGISGHVGQTAALYYMSRKHSLNGRLVYFTGERFRLESEDQWLVAADIWGFLANGFDFFVRTRVDEVRDRYESKGNAIHLATHHRSNKTMAGLHLLWRNLETPYSQRAFAVDGRIVITPNWALYWRFFATTDFAVGENTYARLEYRPNNRLWATFAFGRKALGDDPFLLEDRQLELARANTPLFTLLLRGDF